MPLYNGITAQVQISVTLKGQGHLRLYENVEFGHVFHHSMFGGVQGFLGVFFFLNKTTSVGFFPLNTD